MISSHYCGCGGLPTVACAARVGGAEGSKGGLEGRCSLISRLIYNFAVGHTVLHVTSQSLVSSPLHVSYHSRIRSCPRFSSQIVSCWSWSKAIFRNAKVLLHYHLLRVSFLIIDRDVLQLYKALLIESRRLSGGMKRTPIEERIRSTFRSRASWPRRDLDTIDSWVKRGRTQLTLLRSQEVDSASIYTPRDTN